jgi:hypothetical protein
MSSARQKNRWSADVTAHSDALDLEPKVFEKKTAGQIAARSSDRLSRATGGSRARSSRRCRC